MLLHNKKYLLLISLLLISLFLKAQNHKFETRLDSLAELIDFDYKTGKLKNDTKLFQQIATEISNRTYSKIHINTHTDTRGKASDNLLLSRKVSNKIKELLVAQGIGKKSIETKGYGEASPRGCLRDPRKNRSWNRRVEIIIE